MTDPVSALTLLQYGDSFFPSGATSFSWGLETLAEDGEVTNEGDLKAFVLCQISHRWATFDRSIVAAVVRVAGNAETVEDIDRLVEQQTLAREMREGSRHAGAALLDVHVRLETPGCAAYLKRTSTSAPGHLSVCQGIVAQGLGLTAEDAALLSAHTMCVGLLSAAVRLGIAGHVSAQRILTAARQRIIEHLASDPFGLEDISSYCPSAEIACMRHETADSRLFAT